MKLFAAVLAFLLFAISSPAQQRFPSPTYGIPRVAAHSMDDMVAARAKLIERYVQSGNKLAWGVSICGDDDVLTGEDGGNWLTVYVYSDSLETFALDFDKFATRQRGGNLTVDGITVVVEVIQRPKQGTKNEPTIERHDRQPEHRNGSGNATVFDRPSRA